MDFSLIVILWIIFIVFEKVAVKKKKLPPSQPPGETKGNENFDIPTLANDPNFPGEEVTIFQDEIKPAEVRKFNQNVAEKNFERKVEEKKSSNVKSNLPLNLTAESAMNAIILSEILGKPKALRHK